MSNKAARGTKRTCQECEARFYDLNNDPIICPMCGVVFKLEETEAAPVVAPKPVAVVAKPAAKVAEEGDDIDNELSEIEADEDDDDATVDEDDNTFLETEDEDTDVTGIIGAPAKKNEEEG